MTHRGMAEVWGVFVIAGVPVLEGHIVSDKDKAAAANAAPAVADKATTQGGLRTKKALGARRSPTAARHGQYVNEGAYAKRGSRNGDGRKASARDVIGEVLRESERYVQHLIADGITPQPPRVLAGLHPNPLVQAWEKIVRLSRSVEEGKRYGDEIRYDTQRATATILGSTICSYPAPYDAEDVNAQEWEGRVVAWAEKRYGDHLLGVYAHDEEKCRHIHVLFADSGRNVKPLMAGPAAAIKVMKSGGTKKEAGEALKAANRLLQDEFHAEVGGPVGLGRIGPRPLPKKSMKKLRAEKRKAEAEALAEAGKKTTSDLLLKISENQSLRDQLTKEQSEKGALQLALEAALSRAKVADELQAAIENAKATLETQGKPTGAVDRLLAIARGEKPQPETHAEKLQKILGKDAKPGLEGPTFSGD
jgi:hypothetical protein